MEDFLKSLSLGMLVRSFFAGAFFLASFYVAGYGAARLITDVRDANLGVIASLSAFLGVFAYAFHRSVIYPFIEAFFDCCPCCRCWPPIQERTIDSLIRRWDRAAEDGMRPGPERAKHLTSWADYAHLQYVTSECIAWGAVAEWASSGRWGEPSSPLITVMALCFAAGFAADWRRRAVEAEITRRENSDPVCP